MDSTDTIKENDSVELDCTNYYYYIAGQILKSVFFRQNCKIKGCFT